MGTPLKVGAPYLLKDPEPLFSGFNLRLGGEMWVRPWFCGSTKSAKAQEIRGPSWAYFGGLWGLSEVFEAYNKMNFTVLIFMI